MSVPSEPSVLSVLSELVQSDGEAFYGDAARVESRLHERLVGRAAEVEVLATAVRAGVVHELPDVDPGLFPISVGHLAGRMVRAHGSDPDAARWAVEAWARALGAGPYGPPPPPPAPEAPGTAPAPETAPEAPPPAAAPEAAVRRRRWAAVSWPWAAATGASVIGLIAMVVLVRLLLGLVGTVGTVGGNNAAARPPVTPTVTTVAVSSSPLAVPPGLTLGTGDVQITLLWADGNDLDLHVIDPSGFEIYFANPKSPSGGTLDHDDTAGCTTTGTHVENVFWPAGGAPPGRYRVFVENYSSCGAPSRYSVRAITKGQVAVTSSGTVGALEGDQSPVSEFSFS
ncbi:MAG: hypothetical protein JO265_08625 [Acidimicrobiia bacterium]|nr:hypothetical protein [Acidimicrobiia bacterium]